MQCRGERESGDVFLANVFFSTYRTAMGPRLAALVVDASEDLREREESSLEQLLAGSRILIGAVSHEIRNVCGAISVIYENLARGGTLRGNQDFEALGSLVETLHRIASMELGRGAGAVQASPIDLADALDDLRIVLEPYCQEGGIELEWNVPAELPAVLGDRHNLLQVFLNLTKNSERALADLPVKRVSISVSSARETVSIRVADNGPGIAHPEYLFRPFQKGAEATGLGLFLSRAFLRSVRGDLRHDAAAPGCVFIIDLARAVPGERESVSANRHGTDSATVAR
jgi:signal transduction histidine kinase